MHWLNSAALWISIGGVTSMSAFGAVAKTYTVRKGETLGSIAAKLTGQASYWQAIYSANKHLIKHPQKVRPGMVLKIPVFASRSDRIESTFAAPKRSNEWRNLPRQSWEKVTIALPAQVDPQGFDRSSRVRFKQKSLLELPAWISESEVTPLGTVQSSAVESRYFNVQDRVIVQVQEGQVLSVGQEYTLTRAGGTVSGGDGRDAYEYLNVGTIRILNVQDDRATGEVVNGVDMISRGTYVVAKLPRIHDADPKPAAQAIQGTMVIGRSLGGAYATAQHKMVYIDRGSQDGVSVGYVFRAFIEKDPDTEESLVNTEFVRLGHVQIVQVVSNFSMGMVINSRTAIDDNTKVVSVTDVSDLSLEPIRVLPASVEPSPQAPTSSEGPADLPPELPAALPTEDELDKLDDQKELSEQEKRDLEQLEATRVQTPPDAPADVPTDGPPPELPPDLESMDAIPPTDAAPVPESVSPVEPPPMEEAPPI